MVVVLLYWSLLHTLAMEQFAGQTNRIIYMYTSHTMPALAYMINYNLSDVSLIKEHGPYILVPFATAYFSLNAYLTLFVYGHNDYYFLGDWTGVKSPLIAGLLTLVFCVIYHFLAKFLSAKK